MDKTTNKFGCEEVSHVSESMKSNPAMLEKAIHDLLSDEMKEEVVNNYAEAFKKVFSGEELSKEEMSNLQGVWENIKISQPEKLIDTIRTQYQEYVTGLGKKSEKVSIKDRRDNFDELKNAVEFEKMFWGDITNFIGFVDHLLAGGKAEEFIIFASGEVMEEVEFDESIPNLNVDKEREAQRKREPKFEKQYEWNDKNMKTLSNGRVEFPNGKTILSFKEHEQAVIDTFKGIKDAIGTYEYEHSSGDKITHTKIYYKAFKQYVEEHGGIEWRDSKQLTKNDIMNDYLSNYPDSWSEKEKLTAFEDASPQLFGIRHVIDDLPQVLRLLRNEDIREFDENFDKDIDYGLVLGGNA